MRRVAAEQAPERDNGVEFVALDELRGQRGNLEGARNAKQGNRVLVGAVPGETGERTVDQPGHDLVIESAGDDGHAKPGGTESPLERTRHCGRGLYCGAVAASATDFVMEPAAEAAVAPLSR